MFMPTLEMSLVKSTPSEPFMPISIGSGLYEYTDFGRTTLLVTTVIAIPFIFNYIFDVVMYHWAHRRHNKRQLPPLFPAFLPILGSTIPFLWGGASFVKKATEYAGKLTSTRLSLLVNEIYLFQEPAVVAAMWKHPYLSSPIFVYSIGLRYMFGMHEKAVKTYTSDDSGPYPKPHPDSNIAPHNRVDFLTHNSLLRAFTGSSMTRTFERFQHIFEQSLDRDDIGEEWVEKTDLMAFFQEHVGGALLEALYGPSLLRINPDFTKDLWTFNKEAKHLAKRLPRFLVPNTYRVRDRLIAQVQHWHQYARQRFSEDSVYEDGDGDPFWGSQMSRERQEFLSNADGQDEASVASTDFGLIWTTVTNVTPASMMAALHIFKDVNLLARVRTSLQNTAQCEGTGDNTDIKLLLSNDLLQSIYAETLRLHVEGYVIRCSPHEDIAVGNWWLPRNAVSMVNSYVSHMNTDFWNTQEGNHPVTSFWAERFLVSHGDAQFGSGKRAVNETKATEGQYSMVGLSGAWIPYGGGFGACPGRQLAKRIMLFVCARLVSDYDFQLRTIDFEMDSSGFGLGMQKLKGPVAFAIRRHKSV